MITQIICSAGHLILEAPRYHQCDWERPMLGEIGQACWDPKNLECVLGGLGLGVFVWPEMVAKVAVFPSFEGVLYEVNLDSGVLYWKQSLEPGRMTRYLIVDDDVLLAAISDERPLDQVRGAVLAAINPLSGNIQSRWQVESHQLTPPLLAGESILLRTTGDELVALSRGDPHMMNWRQSLHSWWPLPLHLAGEVIVLVDGHSMQGQMLVRVFSLNRGRLLLSYPICVVLSQPFASAGDVVIFGNSRTQLTALSTKDGRQLWEKEYKRNYSQPVMVDEKVFLCVRGEALASEVGHYLIQCLHAETGVLVGEFPLSPRVRERMLAIHDEVLYFGADDSKIYALRAKDGEQLWSFPLGSDEDLVRRAMVFAGEKLLAGTHFGKVGAVWVAEPEMQAQQEVYLEQGEFELTAAAYALAGDLRRAAELYAREIVDIEKALTLYEHAGLYQEAGPLAKNAGMLKRSLEEYEKAGNQKVFAEQLLDTGNKLGAVRIFKQCGDLMRATKYYEEGGDLRRALDLYWQLKNVGKVIKLLVQITPGEKDIHALEQSGLYPEAGEAALRIHMLEKAAQQAERVTPGDTGRIAGLYEKTSALYEDPCQEKACQECQAKIIYYRKLPWVSVEGQTRRAFREGEFNLLDFEICNIGGSVAYDISLQTGTGRFKLEESTLHILIRRLKPGEVRRHNIALRPYADQIGTVPLEPVWQWKDRDSNAYEERILAYVPVKKRGDSTGGTPQNIHYHGPVYKGQNLEVIGGDKIGGDRIDSDEVKAGAQKGDRVEIHFGQDVDFHGKGLGGDDALLGPTSLNYHLQVEEGQHFCDARGYYITTTGISRNESD